MKKTSILLSLLLIVFSSCGTPKTRPTMSDNERYHHSDDDERHDDDWHHDHDDDDDHWWNR